MKPSDLALIALLVQALALGHGAMRVFYEPHRPKYIYWLPLVLVAAYFVFAAFVPPTILDRSAPVTLRLWLNAWRFAVQVIGFSVLSEMLLYIMQKQRAERAGPATVPRRGKS